MPVEYSTGPFADAYNASREEVAAAGQPELKRDTIFAGRDLGCERVSMSGAPDNWAKLAPLFEYIDGHTYNTLVLDGYYAVSQTLHCTHRNGLKIKGSGGPMVSYSPAGLLHNGTTPGAGEYGGPGGGLIWIGSAGGTMVKVWGSHTVFEGVNFTGLFPTIDQIDNNNYVQVNTRYGLACGILVHVMDNPNGQEVNLASRPFWCVPGKTTFRDCSFNAASVGVWAGTATSGTNHADHCLFDGCSWYWVEDSLVIQGINSCHFTLVHPHTISNKRFIRLLSGGHITVTGARHQGYVPTLLHVCGAQINNGNMLVTNFNVDGTLAPEGFKFMDYAPILNYDGLPNGMNTIAPSSGHNRSAFFPASEVSSPAMMLASLIIDGGSIETRPAMLSPVNGPLARLKGPMWLEFRSYRGLPRWMLGMTKADVVNWGDPAGREGAFTGPMRPVVAFKDCVYETEVYDYLPEQDCHPKNSRYLGYNEEPHDIPSEISGDHLVYWRNCRYDHGGRIQDGQIDNGELQLITEHHDPEDGTGT